VELVLNEPRVTPSAGRQNCRPWLTNDGDLAHRLAHPSHGVEKEYLAEVEGSPSGGAVRRLREGVELEDGLTAPAKVSQPDPGVLRITIHEGRNRQVRRMCEPSAAVTLVRVRIGRSRTLAPGVNESSRRWSLVEAASGGDRPIR
jgi:23S rRNA pseudouridine2605 synthase